jgi:hypothetical protein
MYKKLGYFSEILVKLWLFKISKRILIFALLIFYVGFWPYIEAKKKAGEEVVGTCLTGDLRNFPRDLLSHGP